MFTKAFALDLLERALSTFVQAFLGVFAGVAIVDGSDLKTLAISGASAGLAAVLSLLKSVFAGLKTGTGSVSTTVAETAVIPEPVHAPEHEA